MVRCGVSDEIYCEYRRKGDCENAQDVCPADTIADLFEAGKSIEYIAGITNYTEVEINTILRFKKLIK